MCPMPETTPKSTTYLEEKFSLFFLRSVLSAIRCLDVYGVSTPLAPAGQNSHRMSQNKITKQLPNSPFDAQHSAPTRTLILLPATTRPNHVNTLVIETDKSTSNP